MLYSIRFRLSLNCVSLWFISTSGKHVFWWKWCKYVIYSLFGVMIRIMFTSPRSFGYHVHLCVCLLFAHSALCFFLKSSNLITFFLSSNKFFQKKHSSIYMAHFFKVYLYIYYLFIVIYLFNYLLFIYLFIYLFILFIYFYLVFYLFIYLFIYSFIYLFIY